MVIFDDVMWKARICNCHVYFDRGKTRNYFFCRLDVSWMVAWLKTSVLLFCKSCIDTGAVGRLWHLLLSVFVVSRCLSIFLIFFHFQLLLFTFHVGNSSDTFPLIYTSPQFWFIELPRNRHPWPQHNKCFSSMLFYSIYNAVFNVCLIWYDWFMIFFRFTGYWMIIAKWRLFACHCCRGFAYGLICYILCLFLLLLFLVFSWSKIKVRL